MIGLLAALQRDDVVALPGDGSGDFGVGRFAVAELAAALFDIGILHAALTHPVAGVLGGASLVVTFDQYIEVQITAVAGAHMGVEYIYVHHWSSFQIAGSAKGESARGCLLQVVD